MKFLFTILFSLLAIISKAQTKNLSKQQVRHDLEFLTKTLHENSSYVYLNGYNFNKDFENYQHHLKDLTQPEDFGLFLAETIGKIGDRHSSLRDYESRDSLFLPFIYAPEGNKVLVLKRDDNKKLELSNPKFPYLKKVDEIPVENFLRKILPEETTAPEKAYFTRAVRKLRDIQKIYTVLNKPLPAQIKLTLSDSSLENDTVLFVAPVERAKRSIYWDDEFERKYILVKDEDYNKEEIVSQLFHIKDQIGYMQIPTMVSKEDAPLLFDKINSFMQSVQNSTKALIIDVRSNGGGTRDVTYELAKYFVHPDSIYVVNATKQRAPVPLPKEYRESLHRRNLFSFSELDKQEQRSVTKFLKTFRPMYELDNKKYSEYYFGLFNGKKIAEQTFYYGQPVYILANEKSFSAASVFVAAFKNIPNIKIAGIATDGSSGNSERFELPNSQIRVKISTMVSFQKDGKILDGFGTEPDIKIERDVDQILWKSDTQLEKLRSLILGKN
ncbi:S41 family peptidase [Chryseobacterium gregarium]|uniref:S41 family peptidase n=1 Tax=Chryseobacterium gregarium TaxID=456299 RepID=UPI0003F95CBF|nr:S41 family peptidase [Chryseobacterium gregarium]